MNPIKKNPLGRGLESLIPRNEDAKATSAQAGNDRLVEIDITDIEPNDLQPRYDFDQEALAALTNSVKSKGVLQPVVVVRKAGRYMLVSGERRWRASGLAGLKKIPAVIIEDSGENERLELALIENTQRDDLKPLELAKAYQDLMQRCGYRQEDIARIAGRSRPAVANTLRLLDLPAPVVAALEKKDITEGHARVFLTLPAEYINTLLNAVISKSMSVRQAEAMAKRLQEPGREPAEKAETDPDVKAVVKEIEDFFGSKVALKQKGKSGGVIEIRYESDEDLDKIVNKLRGEIC